MADSETLLQLGIDAAREGRREDARNLFGLLTRQDPDNAQAWLWLAGVAEGPDQRRAALERVVELDPTNEMAVKGLRAMGAAPSAPASAPTPVSAEPEAAPPPPPPAPARDLTDEEKYAAELDSAFDDYDALPRAETPRRAPDETDVLEAGEASRGTSRGSARDRVAARRATTPIRSDEDDEDYYGPPPRRGPSGLLLGLLAAIVLLLLGYLIWTLLSGRNQQVAGGGAAATAAAQTSIAGGGIGGGGTATGEQPTAALGGTGALTGTTTVTSTVPLTSTTTVTDTGAPAGGSGAQPTAAAPAPAGNAGGAIPAPQANPNLQPVAIGANLDANGWTYTYPNANYAIVVGKQVGNFTAQGTYVHVLVFVANNTGTPQPIPANFFALKDANNNVYTAAPQVSSALVQRGVNADIGMEDQVPANGVLTSVYLVFDVTPGAQGLTLFASGNNGQGWPIGIVP